MFNRYSTRALNALFFARKAVADHGGSSIRDVHLAYGLLQRDEHTTSRLPIDETVRQALTACLLARMASEERLPESMEVPFDSDVRRIFVTTRDVADDRGDREITVEHMLIAVIREGGDAAACLREAGIDEATAERLLPPAPPPSPPTSLR